MAPRPSICPAVLFAVVASVAALLCAPNRPGESARPPAPWPAPNFTLVAGPDPAVALVAGHIRAKNELIRGVIAGRVTIRQATDRFLALNAEFPATVTALRDRYPGLSDREMTARNVLDFVREEHLPADDRRAVEARLSEEYVREFGPGYPSAPEAARTRWGDDAPAAARLSLRPAE